MPDELTYDDALEVFHSTEPTYAGGLSNHGPMAVEALVSIGMDHRIGSFVEAYRTRLEPVRIAVEPAPHRWQEWLRPQLVDLVPETANHAGHGLLRVAHAVRGLERAATGGGPSTTRLRELAIAVAYWQDGGRGLAGPTELVGSMSADAWNASLSRLPADERTDGFLTLTFATAAATPDFALVSALAPSADPADTLDALGVAAASAFTRNEATAAFALLHGVTVSNMARVLLPHLDERGKRGLEAAVAGYVAAALIGFDEPGPPAAAPGGTAPAAAAELAGMAGATNEDHTIKFADACVGLAERTGSDAPLVALHRQITTPYGL